MWALVATFIKATTQTLSQFGVGGMFSHWPVYALAAGAVVALCLEQAALHVGPLRSSKPWLGRTSRARPRTSARRRPSTMRARPCMRLRTCRGITKHREVHPLIGRDARRKGSQPGQVTSRGEPYETDALCACGTPPADLSAQRLQRDGVPDVERIAENARLQAYLTEPAGHWLRLMPGMLRKPAAGQDDHLSAVHRAMIIPRIEAGHPHADCTCLAVGKVQSGS
jgi:hypothetical protein